jgi:hypothetical protein
MASEIRVNQIQNRSGLGTVTFGDTGIVISGITTISDLRMSSGAVTVGTGASISSPAANTLALGTNNSERVRISSSGNLGIGTASPIDNLHLQGIFRVDRGLSAQDQTYIRYFRQGTEKARFGLLSSDNAIFFNATANDNANHLVINSSGNIGIGTTNPGQTLTVNGRIESLQDGVGEGGQLILRATARAGVSTQYRWNIDNNDNGTRGADRMRFFRENDTDASSGLEVMSINTDGSLQLRTSGTKVLNNSGNTILRQSGSVIQVVTNTIATGIYSLTATTETVIYNPMITITPTNSNSLIFFDIQFYGYHNANNDFYTSLWVRRNSSGTAISSTFGTGFGDWTRNFGSMVATAAHADYHFTCWDLPGTTSAVNYLLTGLNHTASRNFTLWQLQH